MLQGSDEWRQARCGSIGASDAPRVMRRIKSGGYSADRDSLMAEKVLERLTDTPFEKYKTAAMLRGIEREADARMLYELLRGVEVMQVALFPHLSIKGSHASPDGLVLQPGGTEARGLLEVKCPEPPAHLDTLLNEQISNDYRIQMMWQMACTGLPWVDYLSFNPDFPPHMAVWIRRVHRDAALIAELEREISTFIKEVDRKVAELSRRYPLAA